VNTLKTPAEWADEFGYEILDPDGWRIDGKSFEEPVDVREFGWRWAISTVRWKE
jgi:hypothetical protein